MLEPQDADVLSLSLKMQMQIEMFHNNSFGVGLAFGVVCIWLVSGHICKTEERPSQPLYSNMVGEHGNFHRRSPVYLQYIDSKFMRMYTFFVGGNFTGTSVYLRV